MTTPPRRLYAPHGLPVVPTVSWLLSGSPLTLRRPFDRRRTRFMTPSCSALSPPVFTALDGRPWPRYTAADSSTTTQIDPSRSPRVMTLSHVLSLLLTSCVASWGSPVQSRLRLNSNQDHGSCLCFCQTATMPHVPSTPHLASGVSCNLHVTATGTEPYLRSSLYV